MEVDIIKKRKLEQIVFTDSQKMQVSVSHVPSFQQKLKSFGSFYYLLVRWLGPVFNHPMNISRLKNVCASFGEDKVVLNIGSGPTRILNRKDIINLDVTPYAEVDLLIESETLPILSNSADLVISIAVLEHVPNPQQVVKEIHRCLRLGGKAIIFVPFMQPFHAAPNDYTRWTRPGVVELFKEFRIESSWVGGGPTSGFLWVFQEWLALTLSFGVRPIYRALLYILMIITSPLKLLDLILIYHPMADQIASGFYVLAVKDSE